MSSQPPLMLCMENTLGEEVTLEVEPGDDFQTFLDKAKSHLGYEVDINSITRNQPVSLHANIYQFLLASENSFPIETELAPQGHEQTLEPTNETNDLLYILDDGTQINASQIHFDNEDPHVDLTAEKIPFIKYIDDGIDDADGDNNVEHGEAKDFSIVGSPVSKWSSSDSSPKGSFGNSLPFRMVCSDTSGFEAQFAKYLEANTAKTYTTLNPVANNNKSPRTLIKENYKKYDDNANNRNTDDFRTLTREQILNMFKDPPLAAVSHRNNHSLHEKRRHVRKTDPSRPVHKSWNTSATSYIDGALGQNKKQNCSICCEFVDKDKLYLFDNEDQKIHRTSPSKKLSTHNKIICEQCLEDNFRPCNMKSPNQCLSLDEYLVIRNNQQYVYKKIRPVKFKTNLTNIGTTKGIKDTIDSKTKKNGEHDKEEGEFVKVEIGPDGEIITKPVDIQLESTDDVIIVKDERDDSSSDVEIIEPGPEIDDSVIDNLDDADEEVQVFLGKYQADDRESKELKCRFCSRTFSELQQVAEHGEQHRHQMDDGQVFPCPLCEYGYAKFIWLKGHLKAAHSRSGQETEKPETNNNDDATDARKEPEAGPPPAPATSPIAQRTRSALRRGRGEGANGAGGRDAGEGEPEKKDVKDEKETEKQEEEEAEAEAGLNTVQSNGKEPSMVIKTEVKQETVDTSDEEAIWIVQTADVDLRQVLRGSQGGNEEDKLKKMFKCDDCNQGAAPAGTRRRGGGRGRGRGACTARGEGRGLRVPTTEDFIKRAQGRPRRAEPAADNSLLVEKPRKRKRGEPTSDPQVVTCHDCGDSFTSKVRLKFHMQFHESSSMVSAEGRYVCPRGGCGEGRGAGPFATEAELFDHVHFSHHKQKRWQCPVKDCGKTFYLRATLTKHSRTHTDTRRYVCGACGKRFLDKQTLDEHGVTHLQIKPFQCHICMKQLTRRSRLRMHLRAHEEELRPELVLVCAVCSRAFPDLQRAQEHARSSAQCAALAGGRVKQEGDEDGGERVLLSPSSGLVRTVETADEPSLLCRPIPREVTDERARKMLEGAAVGAGGGGDEARGGGDEARGGGNEARGGGDEARGGGNEARGGGDEAKGGGDETRGGEDEARGGEDEARGGEDEARGGGDKAKGGGDEASGGGDEANEIPPGMLRVVEIEKAFRCEYCEDVFYLEAALNSHRGAHKGVKNPFVCHICKVSFATYSRCTTHKTTHGFFKRSLAQAQTERSGAAVGGSTGAGVGVGPAATGILGYGGFPVVKHFLCEECGRSYLHWTYLQVHRRMKHTDGNYLFRCNLCRLTFPNSWSVAYHRKKVHGKSGQEEGGVTRIAREDVECRTQGIPCRDCDSVLPHKAALYKHRRRLHSDRGTQDSSLWCGGEGAARLGGGGVGGAVRAHSCGVCGLGFRTAALRNEHLRTHTDEPPYPCDVCGQTFLRLAGMRHHRLVHSVAGGSAAGGGCHKRYRARCGLRLRNTVRLLVIEVEGLNPTPELVVKYLEANKVPQDKVLEVTKVSFAKGSTGVVPSCARALARLCGAPRSQLALAPAHAITLEPQQPVEAQRVCSATVQLRRPAILQRTQPPPHSQSQPQPQSQTQALADYDDHDTPDLISLSMPLMLLGGEQLPLVQGGADGAGASVGGDVIPPGQWTEPPTRTDPENIEEVKLGEQAAGLFGGDGE